jgi:putative transposase
MTKNIYIARSRGVSRLYGHLILVTKYRLKTMSPEMMQFINQSSIDLCNKWQCECLEVNGEEDHLHLLFRYAPQLHLSKFIGNLKSVSSRKVRQNFDSELRQFYWNWDKGFWSDGYAIDSVGFAPLDILKQYVQNQGKDRLTTLRSVAQASHPDSESKITEREFSP